MIRQEESGGQRDGHDRARACPARSAGRTPGDPLLALGQAAYIALAVGPHRSHVSFVPPPVPRSVTPQDTVGPAFAPIPGARSLDETQPDLQQVLVGARQHPLPAPLITAKQRLTPGSPDDLKSSIARPARRASCHARCAPPPSTRQLAPALFSCDSADSHTDPTCATSPGAGRMRSSPSAPRPASPSSSSPAADPPSPRRARRTARLCPISRAAQRDFALRIERPVLAHTASASRRHNATLPEREHAVEDLSLGHPVRIEHPQGGAKRGITGWPGIT